jgi:hydrogenase nickel incorporation protein HypA/HybF
MHEYSIVQALLEQVEAEARKHGAASVQRVSVRIGALAGVEPDLLASAYALFRERTICAQAPLDIERVEACWKCPRCAAPIPTGAMLRCPACAVPAQLVGGDEIMLQRIEMEVT